MVRTGRFAWALIPGANTSCGDRPLRRRCWQRRMRDGKAITQWYGTRPEGSGTADKQPRSDVRGSYVRAGSRAAALEQDLLRRLELSGNRGRTFTGPRGLSFA